MNEKTILEETPNPPNRKKWGIIGAAAVVILAAITGIAIYNIPADCRIRQPEAAYAQSVVDVGDLERAIAILEEGCAKRGLDFLQMKMQAEEIRQLVESEREKEGGTIWYVIVAYKCSICHISDIQARELCKKWIDILEPYQDFFTENDYQEWLLLADCYYVSGEYGLCLETRKQAYAVTHDPHFLAGKSEEGDYEWDEYGRTIFTNEEDADYHSECEYEYGKNGKLIRLKHIFNMDGLARRMDSVTISTYEYDAAGRLLQEIVHESVSEENYEQWSVNINKFTYNEKGFTQHWTGFFEDSEGYSYAWGKGIDCEIDEYGYIVWRGEPYHEYNTLESEFVQ